jgi:hypothetical protein
MNRIYRTETDGKPIVHIIGKLDSAKILNEFLTEIFNPLANEQQKENKSSLFNCTLIFDLAETELITEECLGILNYYNKKCSLEFRNCSLYVELLLKDNGLLKEYVSKKI